MPRSDHEFSALGWTRPTVRFDPETTRKLESLRKTTGQLTSELLSTLIDEAFRKSTRVSKKSDVTPLRGDVTRVILSIVSPAQCKGRQPENTEMTKTTTLDLASGDWGTRTHTFATDLGAVRVIEDCASASLVPTPARDRRFAALTADEIVLCRAVDRAMEHATDPDSVSTAVIQILGDTSVSAI